MTDGQTFRIMMIAGPEWEERGRWECVWFIFTVDFLEKLGYKRIPDIVEGRDIVLFACCYFFC